MKRAILALLAVLCLAGCYGDDDRWHENNCTDAAGHPCRVQPGSSGGILGGGFGAR